MPKFVLIMIFICVLGIPAANAGVDLSGSWQQELEGGRQSTWTFTSIGSGKYRGQEQGLGNATAEITVIGSNVRIDWTSEKQNGYSGYTELTLSADGNSAEGTCFYKNTGGGSGSWKISYRRISSVK